MTEPFLQDLTRHAFRSANGERGWSREDARVVLGLLAERQYAILGGEVWWVPDGAREWIGLIPQRHGPDAVYQWTTERAPEESWRAFAERSALESMAAVDRWPDPSELPDNIGGRILYNLTWVVEAPGSVVCRDTHSPSDRLPANDSSP